MNTNWTLVQSLIVSAFVISACTSYHEEEAPVSFGVNVNELSYGAGSSLCPVTVSSGTKWSVASMPSWMSLQSIKPSGVSPYEWTASFVAEANDGYNREGRILINAKSESAEIAVTQEGKKGKYVAVESVSLLRPSLVLPEGESYTMKYTISPWNASEKEVIWISSNPLVASVSAAGIITAVSIGTSRITVKTEDGGRTAVCDVTVKAKVIPVTGVSLDRTSLTMTEGDTQALTATVNPSNATNKSVTWTSDNTAVATVSSSGVVTAKAAGTAIITVKTVDGAETAVCSVAVKAKTVAVTGLSLDRTSLTLVEGSFQTLIATVTPSNATDKTVTWSSSNTSVATVSTSGVVTAKTAGSATITVTTTDGGKKATCSVTVQAKTVAVTGISLSKTSLTLLIGGTEKLTATVLPSNATNKNVSWTSSNTNIATVDSNGNVSAVKEGTAVITATTEDGGKKATCSVTVNPIAVTGVTLNQTSLTMTVGDSQTLSATVTPSNATDKSVNWSSSNTSVATVSSSGLVTAKVAGSATITVTTNDGGKKATCSVTVQAKAIVVTGVSLDKTSLTMTEGETYTLTATVSPANATNKTVTWTSSSNSVATVSSAGVVTAKGVGSATITVTTVDGAKTATCAVTVKAATVPVTGISLNKTSLTMTVGDTQALTATVTPSNATDKSVTWSSSKASVATMSSSGVVTAKAVGTTTITVTTNDGSKTATCSVTVKAATIAVTGVTLNKSFLSMTVGDTETLTATITPSNATDKSVIWSSSKTSVATVSSSGVVTAKAVGTATITVTTNDGSKTATCSVTVKAATVPVTGVSLNKSTLSMTVGDTETLTATVSPSNATDKSLTWSSSKASVATVSSSGVVTAKAVGTATITVTTNDGSKTATCHVSITLPIPEAVDLGLSVKWASFNVGASSPEESGNYYAWGETTTKDDYSWNTYKWSNGTETSLKKYNGNSSYGSVDYKIVLDNNDDVGHVILGGKWRMPSKEEWDELLTNCTWTWTAQKGVYGRLVSSKNGNSIFLPAAGWILPSGLCLVGIDGMYWSSSLHVENEKYARSLQFDSRYTRGTYDSRSTGLPVRPVYGSSTRIAVTEVNLNKTALSMKVGDTQKLTATVMPSNATDGSVTWFSGNTSVATVSSSGVVTAKGVGTATITVITTDGGKKSTCSITVLSTTSGIVNGHEWIDLGLSVKWATCNVGALSPEDFGNYYAWGEVSIKDNYTWATYFDSSDGLVSKYAINKKIKLDLSDDAARYSWGDRWRMPTESECEELKESCVIIETIRNGTNGIEVTSRKNGKSVFLPASGYFSDYLDSQNRYGYYWSSSLSSNSAAAIINFAGPQMGVSWMIRAYGLPIRPVIE